MKIKHETIVLPTGYDGNCQFRRAYIKKHGLKYIGGGAFAAAYAKNKKTSRFVTKIGRCDYTFGRDAYCTFLQDIVLKHQSNPLMPKIRSARFITLKWREPYDKRFQKECVYVIEMERLQSWNKVPSENKVADLLWTFGMSDENDLCEDAILTSARRDTTGHLKQIAHKLKQLYRRFGEDIHDGNVMWRMRAGKKPQIVIIDPAA